MKLQNCMGLIQQKFWFGKVNNKKINMKRKQLGKKGIFLTFIAISIITAFVIMFTPSSIELRKDIVAVKIRVSTLNEHVIDF